MTQKTVKVMFPTFIAFLRSLSRPRVRNYRKVSVKPAQQKENRVMSAVQLEGSLMCLIGNGYSINGQEFSIDSGTWVMGALKPGAKARVDLVNGPGGIRLARKITVLE